MTPAEKGAPWIAAELARRKAWGGPTYKTGGGYSWFILHDVQEDENEDNCEAMMSALRQLNFIVVRDHEVSRRYPLLKHLHHQGGHRTSTLRFHAERYKTGVKIEFYPNKNPDPTDGLPARYASIRPHQFSPREALVFRAVIRKLRSVAEMLGFHDISDPEFEHPRDRIEWVVRDCWHFKGEASIDVERTYVENYNKRDADGRYLRNGEVRYFRHGDGRLRVGRVYFRLNTQWLVIGGGEMFYMSAHELFSDPQGRPRRLASKGKIQRHLQKAVERQDFERAILLRDQIAARAA